ncbi:MAG: hypothetical protein CMO81_09825 [Waddliaceae bacterium]|nr:hypothetical protein [Waddliaceae bacterium]
MFKKKNIKIGIASFILAAGLNVNLAADGAFEDCYFGIFGGANFPADVKTDTFYSTFPGNTYRETYRQDTAEAIDLLVGTHLSKKVRGELEFAYQRSCSSWITEIVDGTTVNEYAGSGSTQTYSLLANAWADWTLPVKSRLVTVYAGGGLGLAIWRPKIRYTGFSAYGPQQSSLELAGQLGTGVNVQLNEKYSLGLAYRVKVLTGSKKGQNTNVGEVTTYDTEALVSHSLGLTLIMQLYSSK